MNPLKVETKWYNWIWLAPLFAVIFVVVMGFEGSKSLFRKLHGKISKEKK